MRTKLALTQVCSSWYGPASEFLYKDIVLRRSIEVATLARTLQAPNCAKFGTLIRSLSVTTAVEKSWTPAFDQDISTILRNAPLIHSLTLKPCLPIAGTLDLMKTAIPANITSLHYMIGHPNYVYLEFLLRSCTKLTHLRLQGPDLSNTTEPFKFSSLVYDNIRDISIPSLQSLRLEPNDLTHKHFITLIARTWVLESLQSFTFIQSKKLNGYTDLFWIPCIRLLERYGGQLKHLHLDAHETADKVPQIHKLLEKYVPLLEHLVWGRHDVYPMEVFHRNLKWVDLLWYGERSDPEDLAWGYSKESVPALQGIRYLRVKLEDQNKKPRSFEVKEAISELPLRFPPVSSTIAGPFGHIQAFEVGDAQFDPVLITWASDSEDDSDYELDPYGSVDEDLGEFTTVSDYASSDEEDSSTSQSDTANEEE